MHLEMNGVCFSYGSRRVLDDVSLSLAPSEVLGILGPNGSGKTTLMRCINRVLTPAQGSVLLDGEDVRGMSRTDIARSMGYVPQNSVSDSVSPDVFEVVLMGRRPYIGWDFTDDDRRIAWDAMGEMGVRELATSDFSRLSSGQAQRVLIARALAQRAGVLLLDEPTSNLDVRYQLEVMDTVSGLARGRGIGVCAIIHDLDLALRYCDKAVLLDGGRIVSAGGITDVLTPDSIRDVYGVEAAVEDFLGRPRIVIL